VTVSRTRVALCLWTVWAVVVWNVVFDRVIVVAGREYVNVARAAAKAGSYAKIEDTMRPARSRALWLATGSAAGILAVGIISIRRLRRT
jgi:hypothetical protein